MKESESVGVGLGQKAVEQKEEDEVEEDYILIDLGSISDHICIPPNAPYQLSALDTPNPILLIDNKIKLIGEYEETIGTCFVFNETDASPIVHTETGPSEANLFSGKCIVDPTDTPAKQLNTIARLDKVLKFRLFPEANNSNEIETQASKQQP